ncbi:ATP-dependent zinc protease family protein [Vibrio genomosp. F10]|uniref:Ribosomal protein S6 modification protein n=3 Tax=Vibrio genomosp. F10 TaxID=723171 RepID=A0A1E5BE68_9VIBR|nr:RimK/LysX family protein [Vibrio genomosp. F10]OEE33789.1 ribosomal protein S6 modification protein [Vibrio genomosp. F10 str. ZF-129]OEE96263.1 ribosomal protein S6 modification protein [Vibrio genomosp. F10 str. 9ZC157]OEF06968.1 ribosomal protein S6 modification protein [Vibrio genomosp. F10 str. 9ZB36]
MPKTKKIVIGRLESIALPDLSIENMHVRVDTGAKTSSLHVDNIVKIKKNGKPHVSFDIHPDVHNVDTVVSCVAAINDIRNVKSSNGEVEERYVIKTSMVLGEQTWPIEITLTDRSDMSYLMLFGREAMGDRCLVDPSKVFIGS